MKPLDFIRTKKGNVGIITEVSKSEGCYTASVEFIKGFKGEKTAWWRDDEIEILDSLPALLSRELAHPMGGDSIQPF